MRRALVAAGLAALLAGCQTPKAWELPPPPPPDAPVVQEGRLHRTTLDNGLTVLVLEDPRLPRVVLGVTFRRGEAMLPAEDAGLASFSAELLQRGAGARDALQFAEAVDRLGASAGAAAGWDEVSVSAVGLSRDLDFLMGVLADMVLAPRFDPAEAERARSERLAALERAKDDPATLAGWYMGTALYDGHRFGVPTTGTAETVVRFDAARARAFHQQIALPNNAVFSVSGDVEAADIIARVRDRFGDWQPGEVPPVGPLPPATTPEARRILVVDRPDLAQARIVVAHEGIARTDDERVAAGLMNLVVGGSGFSSRLMAALRTEEGLTYGVWSGFSMRRAPGPYLASTFTKVPTVRRALDLVLAELERGRSDPPDDEEVAWARTLAVGRFSMGLETSDAVVQALVDLDVHGLPEDSLDTYRARVRATTAEEIARSASDLLHPDRAAIVLVGPAAEIVPQVEDLGPVEVVTP
ncbi:MAG: M16 family metallopeptidase [Myxococcota bacterium]